MPSGLLLLGPCTARRPRGQRVACEGWATCKRMQAPSLSLTASRFPECSALEPESQGEISSRASPPSSPSPNQRCQHPQGLCLWTPAPPQGCTSSLQIHFHSLWPSISNQPATECLCLSVCLSHTQTRKESGLTSLGTSLLVCRSLTPQGSSATLGGEARCSPALALGVVGA